ncbi:MAG TPA: protein TolR [Thermodesulfobacteriota bacterium]|nr:protein TolR [Thermodesulfobacteriota bacterium]
MSQINVTPLVDVMLVLLIIFMVTAPMMQAGIDVKLPKVDASAISSTEEPLVVSIDSRKRIFLNERRFTPSELFAKLAAIHRSNKDKMVLLRADETVPYGVIMETMSNIRKAGIEKVGMVTEPDSGRR